MSFQDILRIDENPYSQILDQLVFKVMFLSLDPGLLITLKEQIDGSVSVEKHNEMM